MRPLSNADAEALSHPPLGEVGQAPERLAGRKNLLQLVQLRWLAVAGQLATILMVQYAIRVPLPLVEMLTLLGVLALFNAASWMRSRLALPVGNAKFAVHSRATVRSVIMAPFGAPVLPEVYMTIASRSSLPPV